jgi:alpha-beta hydrolase superfamily lysophospholipase
VTLTDQHVPVLTWTEPDGIACRGTLVVVPGRGEQPAHYERFGRRIAADGYRVHAVADPAVDPPSPCCRYPASSPDPGHRVP